MDAAERSRVRLECVVEGFGEQEAVPVLLHRWLQLKQPRAHNHHAWLVDTVVTHSCSRIKNAHDERRKIGVECFVTTAIAKGAHGVLVIVDADDEKPHNLGPSLLARAKSTAGQVPVGVVVANREYEAWLLADMWSLRQRGVFPRENRLERIFPPEAKRDAKHPVGELLGRRYEETSDQKTLTAALSFNRGSHRRSPSFHYLAKVLNRLAREARHYALARS